MRLTNPANTRRLLLLPMFRVAPWLDAPTRVDDSRAFTLAMIPGTQNDIDSRHRPGRGFEFDARESINWRNAADCFVIELTGFAGSSGRGN